MVVNAPTSNIHTAAEQVAIAAADGRIPPDPRRRRHAA